MPKNAMEKFVKPVSACYNKIILFRIKFRIYKFRMEGEREVCQEKVEIY